MIVDFFKYQGTGNDFIILDNRSDMYSSITNNDVKSMCDRHMGIGADGLMLLNNKEGFDFEMVYYNADGNKGTMCGNGGRCLVKFASESGIRKKEYSFSAVDGTHLAEIDFDKEVSLKMNDVHKVDYNVNHFILNTGSPHYVQKATGLEAMNVVAEGRKIRNSKEFAEDGINVNFVEKLDKNKFYVRTYERGVEDETLSCGTGITAVAITEAHNPNGFNRIDVVTKGGELNVEFEKISENEFKNIWLSGPAEFVFKGSIKLNR